MSAPFKKVLWLVIVDKTTMMAEVVEANTFKWQHFLRLAQVIKRFNSDVRSPADMSGPFWTREDAERFVRLHHAMLRRRVRSRTKNPLS